MLKKALRALVRDELAPLQKKLDEVTKKQAELAGQLKKLETPLQKAALDVGEQLKKIDERLSTLGAGLGKLKTPVQAVTQIDRDRWKKVAQEGELAFHKRPNFRSGDTFVTENNALWSRLGYAADAFGGKRILDLGAGSRLRSKFFEGAEVYVIEPLADRYMAEVPWCDLKDAAKVYSVPAEERVKELEGQLDFVFSVNVLDHCYNFRECVENVLSYLKEEGEALLVFDLHSETDNLHPIVLNREICREIFEAVGGEVLKEWAHPPFHGGGISLEAAAYTLRRSPVKAQQPHRQPNVASARSELSR